LPWGAGVVGVGVGVAAAGRWLVPAVVFFVKSNLNNCDDIIPS